MAAGGPERRVPSVKTWPEAERPRERLLRLGPGVLSDAEILAILVGSGPRGQSAVDVGRRLAQVGWAQLAAMRPEELCRHPGVGPARAAQLMAALEAGRRFRLAARELTAVRTSDDVAAMVEDMALLGQEEFRVLLLNAKHQVLRMETAFVGGLSSVEVHPREVYRRAVEVGAAAVVAVHNHPSGDPTPSHEDRRLTRRLEEAGHVLGIPLLDHVVIGRGRHVSLREAGLMTGSV
jgi:DNA repair protein RadC